MEPSAVESGQPVPELARLFRILSDELRLSILLLLTEHRELTVSYLEERLGQSQPAVSHHMQQLLAAGLVTLTRRGRFNYYALDPAGPGPLADGKAWRLRVGGVEVGVRRK